MKSVLADPSCPVPHRIARHVRETRDTYSLDLVEIAGNDGFEFLPGQFNMLYMYGVGEVPISISGDPADKNKLVHTIRAYGSVTSRMSALKKGDLIGVRGPFGNCWPLERFGGQDLLLIAGGIGVAPLRPVIYSILANRPKYRKVALLYGERTPGDLIFSSQIEKWRGRFDLDIYVTVDSAREGWRGDVGVVTSLIGRARFDPAGAFALLCGPEVMMYFTIRELKQLGMEDDRIFLSMERNMKCGIGFCGHCQLGPKFVCKDGPVFPYANVKHLFWKKEL